ncbi:MAG: tetratricopeptide repeat protein [Alphaproteobacteria bacterium]|jgi:tetratricopeptide (TPR) repeat protein|nr:tetratricopeptide repeat protein [Alphaproteobacteria bacterium]
MRPLRQWFLLLAIPFAAAIGAGHSAVAEVDHAEQYKACLALVHRQPQQAYESAEAWEDKGGGVWARHCAALALFELGFLTESAERLETLAGALPSDSRVRPATLLAQAANVWLLADDLERAKLTIAVAEKMAPKDATILVDKARILADGGGYEEALKALDRAVWLAPNDDDAHAFRAGALRRLGQPKAALAAAEAALELNPENAAAWLERGFARQALGDLDGAEADWGETTRRFNGTPAADVARAQLEALERR